MARAFDINSSTTRIEIKSTSPKGQVTFTVANRLGKAVEVQAMVVPDDPKRAAWYVIQTDRKNLAADQTETFDVAVTLPAGTAGGDYSFKLVAANVASPDDESTEGPSVAVRYAVVPVDGKHFNWWIVPVIVGALALVGVGAWLLSHRHPVGSFCAKDDDCGGNQKCTPLPSGQNACQLKPQEKCSKDAECSSFWCMAETHKCSRDDGKCASDAECLPPAFVCIKNLCLKKIGERCGDAADCTTGNCVDFKCVPSFEVCRPECAADSICVHGQCIHPGAPKVFLFDRLGVRQLRKFTPQ